jgi:hypothetical protein
MRVKLKESKVSNLILPRRGFLVGLASLLAAPAVVRAEVLMPVKVWRPPLIWRDGMVCRNGVELAVADFPDLFAIVGYMHGGSGPKFRLHDSTPTHRPYAVWYIDPHVYDKWPYVRQAVYDPVESPDLQHSPSMDVIARQASFVRPAISSELQMRLKALRDRYV